MKTQRKLGSCIAIEYTFLKSRSLIFLVDFDTNLLELLES
jgi:hypothetical protein